MRLNRAQRVVLVVALGAAMAVTGTYITTLGNFRTRWMAYAPLSESIYQPNLGLVPWLQLAVWFGLILIWTAASVRLLKDSDPSDEPTR